MAYLKPQSPIKYNEDHIYPLTTADQIIMDSGNRLSGVGVYLEKPDGEDTTVQGNNADTLGGIAASDFVLKTEMGAYEDSVTNNITNLETNVATNYLLKIETASDSNKLGGVDASEFLQKNQVVNNLITEEEGFIADARALMDLKTLFDGLHLSVETRNTTNVKSITVPYPSGSADEGCVVFVNVKDWSTQTTNFGIGCIYNKSGVNGKVIVNTSLISSLTTDGTNITVNLSGANSYVRATAIMFS